MKDNRKKYLEDIQTIKGILMEVEERSIIEPWAFYVWSVLVLLGTILQIFILKSLNWNASKNFLFIWLPVILISSLSELSSWVIKAKKESRLVFSRLIYKFLFSAIGIFSAAALAFVLLVRAGLFAVLPGTALAFTSVIFFLYGIVSYRFLIVSGYVMLALGILFSLMPMQSYWNLLIPTIAGCLICTADGIMIQLIEYGHGK